MKRQRDAGLAELRRSELRGEAERYLASCLETVARRRDHPMPGVAEHDVVATAVGAAAGFGSLGLFTPEEATAWAEQMRATSLPEPPDGRFPPRPVAARPAAPVRRGEAGADIAERADRWPVPVSFRGERLERVLLIDAPAGDDVRVLTAALFDDGLVLDLLLRAGTAQHPATTLRLRLDDDLGTTFHRLGGGGGSSGRWMRWHQIFAPAVPDRARRLIVGVERHQLAIGL
jgi:hypothetical protein